MPQPSVDPAHYREVMGHYPTGVAAVTGRDVAGGPVGLVVGTFTSVSLDPPLVAFLPSSTSRTFALMRESPAFCINVLAHDQLEVARTLAAPRPGVFETLAWSESPLGAPMLADAVAHIHVLPHQVVPVGDHDIVLCAVVSMEVHRPVIPLVFFQGGFGAFSPRSLTATGDAGLIAAVRLAERARGHIESFAARFSCECALLSALDDHELTTLVSACGGQTQVPEALGRRLPLVPPVGEGYMAWQPAHIAQAWLARAPSAEVAQRSRQRLLDIAARGFALVGAPSGAGADYAHVREALTSYALAEPLPARDRQVRAAMQASTPLYELLDVEPGRRYDIGSITVPVLLPDGSEPFVVRASQFPPDVDGGVVREWIESARRTAADVSADLRG